MSQQPTQPHTPSSVAADAYAQAGVDLERGYEVVRRIRSSVDATKRRGMMGGIGGFGGMFDLKAAGYRDPILVSGTDGVGTKLFLAFQTGIHTTVGIDAVAMCVNDVIAQGAEPLFFLDYVAIPKADPAIVADIVHGIASACAESGCALVGGETAEMNDLYEEGTYDIAGFCVAAVERDGIITGADTAPGDVLLGLPSSGAHSNGYSLLRKIFFKDHHYSVEDRLPELAQLTRPDGTPMTLGEVLLTPTQLYVQPVLSMLRAGIAVHGMANITGGGFFENIPRMNADVRYDIQLGSWPSLPIFGCVSQLSGLERDAMFNVFNMGIGYVIALAPSDVAAAQAALRAGGSESYVIGTVSDGTAGKGVHLHE
ncbi:MAG: phosphoribosylformylglycinamidine cyclo-ligase [Actinomycetaceae bacterium]|nr:phosphoribosylformylglycinamidine cyclo-ligase [Actinomycetaceae bacterium]MDY5854829.1 phosphoribosylformylglycinamidine cyclo-ligase [Arcanobacterium sp.]